MLLRFLALFCLLGTLGFEPATAQRIVHVDANADPAGDGSSWTRAFQNLHAALAAARSGDEIWVASGVYNPGEANPFRLRSGVAVYGGFSGLEQTRSQRNPSIHSSVLGRNTLPDWRSQSNWGMQIVRTDSVDRTAILDGFTVRGGAYSSGSGLYNLNGSPTLIGLTFVNNKSAQEGGALFSTGGHPLLIACKFIANHLGHYSAANLGGGAILVLSGQVSIYNSLFIQNSSYGYPVSRTSARGSGGAISLINASVRIINSAFLENQVAGGGIGSGSPGSGPPPMGSSTGGAIEVRSSTLSIWNSAFTRNRLLIGSFGTEATTLRDGGAIRVQSSDPTSTITVRNSIFYGDDLNELSSGANVAFSIVHGGYLGTRVLDANPLFHEAAETETWPEVRAESPAVDGGNVVDLPRDEDDLDGDGDRNETLPIDALGNPRVQGSSVDLGPIEHQISTGQETLPDFFEEMTVHMSPNPARGWTVATGDAPSGEPLTVRVVDLLGREVILSSITALMHRFSAGLDVSTLPSGVYVVRVSGRSETVSSLLTVLR
jgi:hypothetical protein